MNSAQGPSMSPVASPGARRDSATAADIASFYDGFTSRLLRDYVYGNARVEAAVGHVCDHITTTHASVLDVGCGIGYSAAAYAAAHPWVNVHGVDISPRNIDAARRLFADARVSFAVSSMDAPPDGAPFDVIALIDVYEHVPRQNWSCFNDVLRRTLSLRGCLVMTAPSALHQGYLATHDPEGLQVIDETIGMEDVLALCSALEATLTCYKHVTMWNTNDYVHVVIEREPRYERIARRPTRRHARWERLRALVGHEHPRTVRQRRRHVLRALGVDVRKGSDA
jgi:SAM-dependent methyltransferase